MDCIMLIILVYLIVKDSIAVHLSIERAWHVKKRKMEEVRQALAHVPHNDSWPDYGYLCEQLKKQEQLSRFGFYIQDYWNWYSWFTYLLMVATFCIHLVWIFSPVSGLPKNSLRQNQIFSVSLIFNWIALFKYARAFQVFGPFVVMLSHALWDIFHWIWLYLDFLLPFSGAFYTIFGKDMDSKFGDLGSALMTTLLMSLVKTNKFCSLY
jgi:hypothetical protein